MGLCGPLPGLDPGRGPATPSRVARSLQRVALDRACRIPVALAADQLSAVGSGLPTSPPLAGGWGVRDDGARFAHAAAGSGGSDAPAPGRHLRQPDRAIDAGEWGGSWLRRA